MMGEVAYRYVVVDLDGGPEDAGDVEDEEIRGSRMALCT